MTFFFLILAWRREGGRGKKERGREGGREAGRYRQTGSRTDLGKGVGFAAGTLPVLGHALQGDPIAAWETKRALRPPEPRGDSGSTDLAN